VKRWLPVLWVTSVIIEIATSWWQHRMLRMLIDGAAGLVGVALYQFAKGFVIGLRQRLKGRS